MLIALIIFACVAAGIGGYLLGFRHGVCSVSHGMSIMFFSLITYYEMRNIDKRTFLHYAEHVVLSVTHEPVKRWAHGRTMQKARIAAEVEKQYGTPHSPPS